MIETLVSYLFLLINLVVCILSYTILTKEKFIFKKNVFFIIPLMALVILIIRYFNNIYLNLITNIIIILVGLVIFYKIPFIKSLYYSLIMMLVSLFCDAIISMIISNKYLIDFLNFQYNFYFRSLLIIPVCTIYLLFLSIPKIKIIINLFYDKYISKIIFRKINILYFSLIILLCSLFFCFNAYNKVDRFGHFIVILGIFSFILIFIFTLYLLYREYQIKLLNKNIINENKYIKFISEQEEEFKHNLINNLLGIKTVANKKTSKLIDDLLVNYKHDYKNLSNINDLPNGIQSIIYRKAYDENIENLNLIVDNLIEKELYDILNPKKYNHLCTSIGILFDNALEAVKDIKNKIIEINFFEDEQNLYIILKNSFSNVIDLENIGKKNYSTKEKGHGIGLNYLLKLKTIVIKNEIINDMFISKLIIKK